MLHGPPLVALIVFAVLVWFGLRIFAGDNPVPPPLRGRQRAAYAVGLPFLICLPAYLVLQFKLYPGDTPNNPVVDMIFAVIIPSAGIGLLMWAIWLSLKQKREAK
jgi:hypothetical protein